MTRVPPIADPRRSARLASVRPYAPPKAGRPIDLKLDANEGPAPGPGALVDLDAASINRYPTQTEFERQIAAWVGTTPERVVVTAGGDDGLLRAAMATLEPGREAVLTTPTFEMIPRYVTLAGGVSVEVPWPEGAAPTDAIGAAIGPATSAVFLVTPNNPTGAWMSAADVRRVAEAAGDRTVVLDLAYTEFADEDLTALALELENVVAVRTFSKAWGLAGCRVGFAVGSAERVGWLRAIGQVYAVAGPSLAIASNWLRTGSEAVRAGVDRVVRERGRLTELLGDLGARPVASRANFVLGRWDGPDRAAGVATALGERGIGVRRFDGPGPLRGCLRITCPGHGGHFDRLERALREVLA